MGTLNHINDLFIDTDHRITKSHCFICHKKLNLIDKEHLGNACPECNSRANKVARGLIIERESDILLLYQLRDLEIEKWNIDGVDYKKFPDGTLKKYDRI
jgi:hypothetical protein